MPKDANIVELALNNYSTTSTQVPKKCNKPYVFMGATTGSFQIYSGGQPASTWRTWK